MTSRKIVFGLAAAAALLGGCATYPYDTYAYDEGSSYFGRPDYRYYDYGPTYRYYDYGPTYRYYDYGPTYRYYDYGPTYYPRYYYGPSVGLSFSYGRSWRHH